MVARMGLGKMRIGALVAIMLAGCSATSPDRVVEARAFAGDAPRGTALMRRAMIEGHDAARAAMGVGPLRWSDSLAADAQGYADTLARSGRFEHSTQPPRAVREGEKLWTRTPGAFPPD